MKSRYGKFATFYVFIYLGIGALYPLIGQYLDHLGFSGSQIGQITSLAVAVGIVGSPLGGAVYHHLGNNRIVTLCLCFIMTAGSIALIPVRGYWPFLLLYAALIFFQAPIWPLADAMTLEEGLNFGAVRRWGAIGYAVGTFVTGQLAARVGLGVMFPFKAVTFFIAGLLVLTIVKRGDGSSVKQAAGIRNGADSAGKTQREAEASAGNKGVLRELLRNKKLLVIYLAAASTVGSTMSSNTYFSFLYIDGGGTLAGIGTIFLVMISSEAIFMSLTGRLSQKITLERTILLAIIISTLRFFWYSTNPSSTLLLITCFIQGIVNGIALVEFVRYVEKVADPKYLALAIAMFQAVAANGSQVICQLGSGYLLEHFGSGAVYLGLGLFNAVGAVLYLASGLHKPHREKAAA